MFSIIWGSPPAGGWKDILLLGPLYTFLTLCFTHTFLRAFIHAFIHSPIQIPAYAVTDKNRGEIILALSWLDCIVILRHYFVLKGNIKDI